MVAPLPVVRPRRKPRVYRFGSGLKVGRWGRVKVYHGGRPVTDAGIVRTAMRRNQG